MNTLFTLFVPYRPSPRKTGVASLNPLAAPACELPAGHSTLTEALLSSLNHPWPHRERPTTTGARPPMAIVAAQLRKGVHEAAHRMLMLHACDLIMLLVVIVLIVAVRGGLELLHTTCHTCRFRCLARCKQVGGPVIRRHTGRLLWIPEALVRIATATTGPAAVAWDVRMKRCGEEGVGEITCIQVASRYCWA